MKGDGQNKTSLGLSENIEGLLCYLLMWVTGIVFLVLERGSRFVRFHAIQALITFLPLAILSYIVGAIPLLGGLLSTLVWIAELVLWVLLMYKAYNGIMYKLPVVGDIAEHNACK